MHITDTKSNTKTSKEKQRRRGEINLLSYNTKWQGSFPSIR